MNPNLKVLELLAKKMAWDLQPEAFRSRKILREIKDRERGRKAVILCNGPSLLKTDFEMLKSSGAYVIGLNKINLLFDKTDLRPDAVIAVNGHVIEQNEEFYNKTDLPLFLSHKNRVKGKYVRSRSNVAHICVNDLGNGPQSDITWAIHEGCTVTTPAMQLAIHLGCTSIGIIGCDHNFTTKGDANKEIIAEGADLNHFDPKYFSGSVRWNLPDLLGSEISYLRVKLMAERMGVQIKNCTEGGKLEVFDRQTLSDFLEV